MKKQKVLEVTQFFNYRDMTWKELIKTKEKGVLPSTDNTSFLWTETPKLIEVTEEQTPDIGDVWLINKKGKPVVFKANYDSSE